MTSTSSSPSSPALPRFATSRNPARPTLGPEVAALMELLGKPAMPWQRHVLDVACELNPDGSWAYPIVSVTVPRQSGKTFLVGCLLAHRALKFTDHRGWMTAQTGLAARGLFHEMREQIEARMPGTFKWRLSAGEEGGRYEPNRSFFRVFSPKDTGLHGQTVDAVVLDECWSFSLEQGDSLMQAIVPTQATRAQHRQTWLISTAGDTASLWFGSQVERGRLAVADPDSRRAHFEWSAEDGAQWDDPEVWARVHPAYGITQDHEYFLNSAAIMGETQFKRGLLNMWSMEGDWRRRWDQCPHAAIPEGAPVWIGADAPPSHSHGSIVAAGLLPDGTVGVEVLEHSPGIEWMPRVLEGLWKRHGSELLLARTGPIGHLVDQMSLAGVPVTGLSQQDYTDAINIFLHEVTELTLSHRDQPTLNQAVLNSVVAESGERMTFRRRDQGGYDISPTVAASLAVYGARLTPGMQVF